MGAESTRADGTLEARIARLESDVAHMRADIGEIKVDLRALRGDVGGLRTEIASVKVWGLTLSMTIAGAMLAVMARGFGWL
jgi:hypothetical protein